MNSDALKITKEIKLKYKTLYEHMYKIETIKEEIGSLKKNLFITCNHDWFKDSCEPFDSICKWKCKHCDLARNTHCN